MQRKNNFLINTIMSLKFTRSNNTLRSGNKRNGFAMIMAIAVIVVVTALMTLSLQLVTKTGKKTTDTYLHEQVVLYSISAAELALLNISNTAPCTYLGANYAFAGGLYNANVAVTYIYFDDPATLPNESPCNPGGPLFGVDYVRVNTPEQSGSVLMDITVTTVNAGETEPIRYFRRSIQKL